jgi:hypothetical protein
MRPSFMACYTATIEEVADYLPPYFADSLTIITSSVEDCLLSQLRAWLSGSKIMGVWFK